MTTVAHERLSNISGGKGIEGWIQPACSCGWKGKEHFAHLVYQYTNAGEEFRDHRSKANGNVSTEV